MVATRSASSSRRRALTLGCAIAGLITLNASFALAQARATKPAPVQPKPARRGLALAIKAPSSLVLGKESNITISYHVDAEQPAQLFANIGSLSEPVPTGGGNWQLTYTPPVEKYPQVAILALVSEDGAYFTWTTIALHGAAHVELSSDPEVNVAVHVGSASFGPVKTDKRGRAKIPVIVPPGTHEAISLATDSLGNERRQTIPIAVPPFQRLLSVCPRREGRGVWAFAVDERGAPDDAAPLTAAATPVSVAGITARAPGVYRLKFNVPEGVRAGEPARVSLTIQGAPASRHGCAFNVPLELPHQLELALAQTAYAAGSGEPIKVVVTPRYRGARDPEAAELDFTTTLGHVSPERVRSTGPVEVAWYVPDAFRGQHQATLSVRAGTAHAAASIGLSPGQAKQLHVATLDSNLETGTATSTQLMVEAQDAFGNDVPDVQLSAAAAGSIGKFRRADGGGYAAEYQAPEYPLEQDRVVVSETRTGVSAGLDLRLRSLRGRVSLAVHGGYLTGFEKVSGPLLLLQLGYRLPFGAEHLRLSCQAGYYQSAHGAASLDGRERIATQVKAIPVLARLEYVVHISSYDLGPFVGGGALFSSTEVSGASTGTRQATPLVPLWAAGIATSVATGPGRTLLEVGYFSGRLDTATVTGNAAGWAASLGYMLDL